MARNDNFQNFNNTMLFDFDDSEKQSIGADNFAWTNKKKRPADSVVPKKQKREEKTFSYHPVTNFKDEEFDIVCEPEKKQSIYQPPSENKPLQYTEKKEDPVSQRKEVFVGKDKNFTGCNFSGKDLSGADFSGAVLKDVDFSGAILSDANFANADLTGAVFSRAVLNNTNFSKAKMHNVTLENADIQDAILLDAQIDNLTLEELQELIEFLAEHFPHKLNLARINILLLDLSKINLKNVNLRGVDFTGVDFTNIDISELDLSECIITPEQIAQALGRVPTPLELRRILAPKKKKKQGFKGVDFTEFFLGHDREVGVSNAFHSFSNMDKILETGKKVINAIAPKPEIKDDKIIEKFEAKHEEVKTKHNEDLRRAIEENRRAVLEQKRLEKEERDAERKKEMLHQLEINSKVRQRGQNERS